MVIARAAGTVSSSGPSIWRSTRRPANSGSSRSTGSLSPNNPSATRASVAAAVVDAIGRGEDPPFEADDERAVYMVARQLSHSGRLDQETYDAAHRVLGDAGMVELVSLCGYYTLVSFLLNAFAVPLPPDAAPMWAES